MSIRDRMVTILIIQTCVRQALLSLMNKLEAFEHALALTRGDDVRFILILIVVFFLF